MLIDAYKHLVDQIENVARTADALRRSIENAPPAHNQPIQLATGVCRIRDLLRTLHKYELYRYHTWLAADQADKRQEKQPPDREDDDTLIV